MSILGFRIASSRVGVACLLTAVLAFSAGCASRAPATTVPTQPDAGAAKTAPPPAVTPAQPAPPASPTAPVQAAVPDPATRSARPPAPPPLLGHLTRVQVRDYESWKSLFDQPYAPDSTAVETIRPRAADVTVLLIMGTWCGDSKREVPRFFAIMDAAGLPESAVTMVGVDRTKKDTEGLTEKWGVTRVPTFILLRNGQEVGRVVERTPQGSTLEAEIAKALRGPTLS